MTDLPRPMHGALSWVAKQPNATVDAKQTYWSALCAAARQGLVHMVPINKNTARVTLTDAGRKSVQDAEAEAKRPKRLSY